MQGDKPGELANNLKKTGCLVKNLEILVWHFCCNDEVNELFQQSFLTVNIIDST